jgi:hypothetical protein
MKYEDLKELIEEICEHAVNEMEKKTKEEDIDQVSESIADEIIRLRKEVAQAWFMRHYDRHYRAFEYAKEKFLGMDLKERKGRSSAEILKELSVEYINKQR